MEPAIDEITRLKTQRKQLLLALGGTALLILLLGGLWQWEHAEVKTLREERDRLRNDSNGLSAVLSVYRSHDDQHKTLTGNEHFNIGALYEYYGDYRNALWHYEAAGKAPDPWHLEKNIEAMKKALAGDESGVNRAAPGDRKKED